MRGKPVDKLALFMLFDNKPQARVRELMQITGFSSSTLYRYRNEWYSERNQAKSEEAAMSEQLLKQGNKPKPKLTVPQRYKESDVRFAVVSGCVLGIIFTITAAAVAGVI